MLTHHLASSPPWPPRAQYESPVLDESTALDNSDPSLEDFDGPGDHNERDALTSSITEASGLECASIKEQGIVFWAKNIQDYDSNEPGSPRLHGKDDRLETTTSRSESTSRQHHKHFILASPASPADIFTPQPKSEESDQPIFQVLQEIRTLERIANRLTDLYRIRDRLIRRGSRRA